LLTVISFAAFVILIELVVGILYNDKYASVSHYASLLAIGTSLHGLGDMINRFLGAHGQGKMLRNSALISGATLIFGNFVFVYFWHIYGAVLTKCLGSAIYLVTMIVYYRSFVIKTSTKKC